MNILNNIYHTIRKKISSFTPQSKEGLPKKIHIKDIPKGSVIQIFDEKNDLYEFTVSKHTHEGSFVQMTKFNHNVFSGEDHSKIMHPEKLPSSKFSIGLNEEGREHHYSIQSIKRIKILDPEEN